MLFTQFKVQISTVHFKQDLYKSCSKWTVLIITLMIYILFCFVYARLIIEGCKVVDLTEKVTTLKKRIDDMENEQNMTN